MIEVKNLTRRYGSFSAVKNVAFEIGRHEIVGLLGHNGAGKSTIMKMLSGYLEPNAGEIHIAGHNLATNPLPVQRMLGYLPESLPVYPEMMVADYLSYAATLKGIPAAERDQALQEVLQATDLRERALDVIGTLSRGLKQRVGVAQALLGRPRLLILDEPTNGLDPHQTDEMRKLIQSLSKRATIILSTHIMQEVEAVCDRVLVLSNGKLVLDESMSNLRESRRFSLCTDDTVSELTELIAAMPEVADIKAEANTLPAHAEFVITLEADADSDEAAGNIGQAVINAGAKLYSLRALVRDLETVFREASERAEVTDVE
ncbi:MAG: ABC transporter ATP-binding protein [Halieaceae bacterium]